MPHSSMAGYEPRVAGDTLIVVHILVDSHL